MSAGIFLWEDPDGTRNWEAYASWDELKPMIAAQLNHGADPAKMMISAEINWLFPGTHKGRKTVWRNDILDICNHTVIGTAAPASETTSKCTTSELGWISPDGRFFPCEYGCHTEKAREIIGQFKPVSDPRWYLEAKGWLAIYKNPVAEKSLAIGMAREYPHISDRQLQTLQRLGIDSKIENISSFL